MPKTKFCKGLSDISDTYMAMIFDQWGVLHNGVEAYDGIIDCLKELRSRKKVIILLSNTMMRETENKALLKKMGIGPSLYDRIISVGEFISSGFEKQENEVFKNLGSRYYSFHKGGVYDFIEGVPVERVNDVTEAEFVLVTGHDILEKSVKELEPELKKIVQKGLKTVFAIPDSRGLLSPNYIMGPGLLVRRLRDFGGVIFSAGKPHKPIFQECINYLQSKDIYPGHTVMIGDTMAHDMVGANMSEIDACFVKSGLHSGTFRNAQNLRDVDMALNVLIAQYNVRPNYLIERVKWGEALPDRKHRRRLQPGERARRRQIRRKRLSKDD